MIAYLDLSGGKATISCEASLIASVVASVAAGSLWNAVENGPDRILSHMTHVMIVSARRCFSSDSISLLARVSFLGTVITFPGVIVDVVGVVVMVTVVVEGGKVTYSVVVTVFVLVIVTL